MITAFIGAPGCGKSTALAWVARRATQRPNKPICISGFQVSEGHPLLFTNFPFPGAYQLDYENLGKYNYQDCLILIDEISMYSDSRDYKNFTDALKFFFTQHRKGHVDLIWCSQAYDDSDKKIRNLTVAYYMIEPWFFGLSRFCLIEPFTDIINYKLVSGYQRGRNQYFRRAPLFSLFDSYKTLRIDMKSLPDPPLVLWNEPTSS